MTINYDPAKDPNREVELRQLKETVGPLRDSGGDGVYYAKQDLHVSESLRLVISDEILGRVLNWAWEGHDNDGFVAPEVASHNRVVREHRLGAAVSCYQVPIKNRKGALELTYVVVYQHFHRDTRTEEERAAEPAALSRHIRTFVMRRHEYERRLAEAEAEPLLAGQMKAHEAVIIREGLQGDAVEERFKKTRNVPSKELEAHMDRKVAWFEQCLKKMGY